MDWWHEDPELLTATLFMLSDEEPLGHQSSNSSSSTDDLASVVSPLASFSKTTTPTLTTAERQQPEEDQEQDHASLKKRSCRNGSSPATTTKRCVNVSRERRRDEVRYLREKAVDLEAQLSILKHRREEMLRPHMGDDGEIRSIAVVWEELATRQFRERKRAELMNTKLKTMLETQLRVTEDLITAIRRAEEESRRQQENAYGLLSSSSSSRVRLAIDISQKVSEQDQLERLDVLCTQWQDAFSRSRKFHDGASVRFLDLQLLHDNGVEAVVEVCGSWALPFARTKVEETMMRFYLEEFAEEDGHTWAQDYESRDDNTIIGVFHASSVIDSHRMSFDGKYVAKNLRNAQGHMMLVSHAYSEPRCLSNLLEDVALEEDMWTRIADAADVGGPVLACPLTVVQHVRRMNIRFGASQIKHEGEICSDVAERRRVGALTEFLMLQVEDEMRRGEQVIENMLLEHPL